MSVEADFRARLSGALRATWDRWRWALRPGGRGSMTEGPGRGLRFDPGPSNPAYGRGDNELPVQEAMRANLRRGDVVFDVGANVGFFSVLAARWVGGEGRVFAFEPVPANAAFVRRNAARNGFGHVSVIEAAVSSSSGRTTLALSRYSGGAALLDAGAPPDRAGVIEVDSASLDDLVRSGRCPPPAFVKIDVEGAEMQVLEGMAGVIAEHKPILLYEVDGADEEVFRRRKQAYDAWVAARGYALTTLPDSYPDIRWKVGHVLAVPLPPRKGAG